MKVMLLFFEDGEEDIVLKVQNLIRSVTRIDYMEMPQFETQSTSSALEIRENQRRVFCYGQEIFLTKTEYEILLYLYKNANHVLTHGQIYERVWREPDYPSKVFAEHVEPQNEFCVQWGLGHSPQQAEKERVYEHSHCLRHNPYKLTILITTDYFASKLFLLSLKCRRFLNSSERIILKISSANSCVFPYGVFSFRNASVNSISFGSNR